MATILALLALVPVFVATMVTGDGPQMIYKPPSLMAVYRVYRYRNRFMAASALLWVLAVAVHLTIAHTSLAVLIITGIMAVVLTVMAFFLSPFIFFPPIRKPAWLSAEEADQKLSPDTQVLGIEVNGDARAYPVEWIMRPHVVEDTIGSERVTMTFCVLSNLGQAYLAEQEGHRIHFIMPTQWENNLVLYDTRSKRMFQQIQGEIASGHEQNRPLAQYPVRMMRWSAWRKLYPHTKVFYNPPTSPGDRLMRVLLLNKAVAGLRRGQPFFPTIERFDSRLPKTTEVIGIQTGDRARAYTPDYLRARRLVNDTLGAVNLLLVADPHQDAIDVFNRTLRGKTLQFEGAPDGEQFAFRDTETGSLWDMRGYATDGPMKGDRLEPLNHASKVYWYVWYNFYPHTELMS